MRGVELFAPAECVDHKKTLLKFYIQCFTIMKMLPAPRLRVVQHRQLRGMTLSTQRA